MSDVSGVSRDMQVKIAKLLAKAERTDNPAEAEAFTEAAERLMIKWGIEEALVRSKMTDGGSVKPEQIVRDTLHYDGRYSQAHVGMAALVLEGLGSLRCYIVELGNNRRLTVVGHESDVARAKTLLISLQLQAVSAQQAWWKAFDGKRGLSDHERFKARRQFLYSFGVAVKRRLVAMRTEEVQAAGNGTDLVLASRDSRVDAWMKENVGPLRERRSSLSGSLHGRAEGLTAGQSASLGGPSVGGNATKQLA